MNKDIKRVEDAYKKDKAGMTARLRAGGLLLLSSILFKNVRLGNGDGRNERRRKRELKRYMHD